MPRDRFREIRQFLTKRKKKGTLWNLPSHQFLSVGFTVFVVFLFYNILQSLFQVPAVPGQPSLTFNSRSDPKIPGYSVFNINREISREIFLDLKRFMKENAYLIFNNKLDKGETKEYINNEKRWQGTLRSGSDYASGDMGPSGFHKDLAPGTEKFLIEMYDMVNNTILGMIGDGTQYANGMVALWSKEGCQKQGWHTDYNPDLIKNTSKPMAAVLAIEEGSTLEIESEGKAVTKRMNTGEILVFDGDMVHSGSAYDKENLRLHFYIHSTEYKIGTKSTVYKPNHNVEYSRNI